MKAFSSITLVLVLYTICGADESYSHLDTFDAERLAREYCTSFDQTAVFVTKQPLTSAELVSAVKDVAA